MGTFETTLMRYYDINPLAKDYTLNAKVFYSGPLVSINDFIFQRGTSGVGITYSYKLLRKELSMTDIPLVIYYDPNENCPNYNLPCNDPSHYPKTPDWASKASYTALFWMEVTQILTIFGIPQTSYYFVDGAGVSSGTQKYYKGSEIN